MPEAPRPKRSARTAVVSRTQWLTPTMVRLVFTGDDLRSMPPLPYTDHYVKILFPPAAADYRWPFDADAIKETRPASEWPVTRTYTIRAFDPQRNEMTIDFVVHGDEGLAGPWAAAARPGDAIGFFGPGGAFAPDATADVHLLVGDESAIPAIGAILDRLPDATSARVFLEVAGPEHRQPLPTTSNTSVTWVHRDEHGLDYGQALSAAVRASELPEGSICGFIHGNAEMVRDIRRFLFVERGVNRKGFSISGYWRPGHTEDGWQASKREFNQQMEQAETVSSG